MSIKPDTTTSEKSSKLSSLEYLPASRQTPRHQQEQNTAIVIEQKKLQGYLQEPTNYSGQASSQSAPMMSYYDEVNRGRNESTWSKLYNIGKYNPFVPLGCLVTLGVLANGVWAMRKKDTAKSQRMMRYRIAAQGTTIIALVVGTMISQYLVTSRGPPPPPPQQSSPPSSSNGN